MPRRAQRWSCYTKPFLQSASALEPALAKPMGLASVSASALAAFYKLLAELILETLYQ
jgi:hypothetical protein